LYEIINFGFTFLSFSSHTASTAVIPRDEAEQHDMYTNREMGKYRNTQFYLAALSNG
jgi:hypothetical protein